MNTQRLMEAAHWAEKNINPEMFDMVAFRENGDIENPICNSVGCLVGHLTGIDSENVKENYYSSLWGINFTKWSKNYFDLTKYEWNYLFSPFWIDVDNTLQGAIGRMRRLANGMTEQEIKIELKKI